jgi:hypothetical protein
MRYRIRFLNRSPEIIRETTTDVRSAAGVIALVAGIEWPPDAITLQIVDVAGREIYRLSKSQVR